jgi:transposase
MLRMDQVHVIRHKGLREGLSIWAVAKQMGLSRNTVAKYLQVPEPHRQEKMSRPRPVLERVAPRIEELLQEWRGRTTAKQRLTGARLHRQLVEEGYQVGITTVRDYLWEKRRQAAEVYIPLVHRPGEEGQVDFFQVTAGGVEVPAAPALLRAGLPVAV